MKGYGIFVGVNAVNKHHYRSIHRFRSAKKNAISMYEIAEKTGLYEISKDENILTGKNATWANTRELLKKFINHSYNEDGYVFAYFSGHGFSVPKAKGDSSSPQYLCFHDRMVPENEVRDLLTEFSERFKILFVIDSCFSDGIASTPLRLINGNQISNLLSTLNYVTYQTSSDLETDNSTPESSNIPSLRLSPKDILMGLKWIEKFLKKKSVWSFLEIYLYHYTFYRGKEKEFPSHDRWDDYNADICYLSACQYNQTALRGRANGLSNYTEYFNLLWKHRPRFYGNYDDLNNLLVEGLHDKRKPIIRMDPTILPNSGHFFQTTVPINFIRERKSGFKLREWQFNEFQSTRQIKLIIAAPSSMFFQINFLERQNQSKVDLIEVKKFISCNNLDEKSIFIIVQIGVRSASRRNHPIEIIPKKVSISKGKQNLFYLIYDFDHNKVLAYKKSEYQFKWK